MSIRLYKVHWAGDPVGRNEWLCEHCCNIMKVLFNPLEATIHLHEEPRVADRCNSCARINEDETPIEPREPVSHTKYHCYGTRGCYWTGYYPVTVPASVAYKCPVCGGYAYPINKEELNEGELH